MDDQEKLFNLIKIGCTLLHNNKLLSPRAVNLNNCRLLITKAQTYDKLYITYKSNDLLTISYKKESNNFICCNSISDFIIVDKEILSMDLTQYILSYRRLNDFILGTLCGLFVFYDEISEGIKSI